MYSKNRWKRPLPHWKPWFAIPGPVAEEFGIAFGLLGIAGGKGTPEGIYALDTGCCWWYINLPALKINSICPAVEPAYGFHEAAAS